MDVKVPPDGSCRDAYQRVRRQTRPSRITFVHPRAMMSHLLTPLLVFLATIVVGLVLYWPTLKREWTTTRDTIGRETAQQILDDRKRGLSKDAPPAPAQIRQFSFRGYAFYDSSQRALEQLGCSLLGDFELDQRSRISRGFDTFVRVLRSDDRQFVCSLIDATPHLIGVSGFVKFRFYLSGRHRHHLKWISFRTELSDGRFVITATDADVVREGLPPEILTELVR